MSQADFIYSNTKYSVCQMGAIPCEKIFNTMNGSNGHMQSVCCCS